jgi:hypothetical protein
LIVSLDSLTRRHGIAYSEGRQRIEINHVRRW